MAYVNVTDLGNFKISTNFVNTWTGTSSVGPINWGLFVDIFNDIPQHNSDDRNYELIYTTENNAVQLKGYEVGRTGYTQSYKMKLYANNIEVANISSTYKGRVGIFMGIDEENQVATFSFVENVGSGNSFYNFIVPNSDLYNAIKSTMPPEYNWQSVPSISGKNGILSLVTLDSEAINDGEPVSGAAISVFDQAPSTDNNVKDLADTYGSGEESSAVDVTVKYKVTLPPGGSFSVLKLVAKKDSIPEDATDGDKIVDISPTKTKKTVTGLDENSMYYFKIFAEDSNSNTSESDEKHILTSGDEGYNFDYTGEIVEWTVPKTGIYSLETWGAQGGNATDGTNVARGGYGAYAYGEVFLTQGDTLYINVGGQNGYGGGGGWQWTLLDNSAHPEANILSEQIVVESPTPIYISSFGRNVYRSAFYYDKNYGSFTACLVFANENNSPSLSGWTHTASGGYHAYTQAIDGDSHYYDTILSSPVGIYVTEDGDVFWNYISTSPNS